MEVWVLLEAVWSAWAAENQAAGAWSVIKSETGALVCVTMEICSCQWDKQQWGALL